jgi:outer membrane protein assembly complex protein YaeT
MAGRWGLTTAAVLLLAPGARALAAPAGPPLVTSVELRTPAGEDRAGLVDLVAIAPGDTLSARALRRTVLRLFQTGRFRNVIVRVVPLEGKAGSAALVVECLPLRKVRSVRIVADGEGQPLDERQLRAAARLGVGDPFGEEDLDLAATRLREALARRGYREARVDRSAAGETAVDVELRVTPGPPTRVAAVRLTGDPGPAARLAEGLATRPGAVLDEERLAEDARALRDGLWREGHRRARVASPSVRDGPGGAEVEIAVEAGPRVRFAFRGNSVVPTAELRAALGVAEGEPADLPAVEAAAERVRVHYRARGHAAVRVELSEETRPGRVTVVFSIEEGRTYRIGAIRVEGLEALEAAAVAARLRATLDAEGGLPEVPVEADRARLLALSVPGARPPPSPPSPLPPSDFWDEEAWDRAAERLVDEYRADGWLSAAYLGGSAALDARTGRVEVTVRLREGPRTMVESISFEGNAALSIAELAREARLAPGEPLSFEKVEATRVAILRRYLSRGFAFARVEARSDPDAERRTAAIRYRVEEGPEVRIGRVLVTGNRRTREDLVRRTLTVAEGDLYSPEAVARSQVTLLRLGVFRSVGLRLQDPDAPEATKDLSVELVERPWQTFAAGAGFSIANGPRAFAEYGRPNLFGRAVELSGRAKVNYPLTRFRPDLEDDPPRERIEGRVEAGLRQPRPEDLPFPLAVRANLVGEILHRRAYDLDRVSGIAGVDLELTSRAIGSLQYELEVDDITPGETNVALSREDLERLRFGVGVTTLQSLRPSVALDFRDNVVHPRSGWFASGAVEITRSIGEEGERVLGILPGSETYTNLVKLSTTVSGYLPVGPAAVLALSARGGRILPLDPASTTPVPRRFFLGGASTMRGYAEDEMVPEDERPALREAARWCAASLSGLGCTEAGRALASGDAPVSPGGEVFVLLKSELRIRLRPSLEAGLFADVGNLWLEPKAFSLFDLRVNLGVGLRFVTPIGPAALDVGFNVTPDRLLNERTWAPHFAIGLF